MFNFKVKACTSAFSIFVSLQANQFRKLFGFLKTVNIIQ